MHQVAAGQTVVVHSAAGGCGIVAVQIAKALGAQVIGTVSSDAKIEFVRRYGADHVINYATHDFAAEVLRITGGRGAGLVLDAIGKPTFEQGVKCLAPFGHIILYGRSGGPPDRFNLFKLADKSLKVSFFFLWTVFEVAGLMQRGLDGCFQLMREGKLKQVVGRTFPLHEAAAAHRLIESRGSIGKLLLIPHHAMSR
jgi:NADPH2:quinone reductase